MRCKKDHKMIHKAATAKATKEQAGNLKKRLEKRAGESRGGAGGGMGGCGDSKRQRVAEGGDTKRDTDRASEKIERKSSEGRASINSNSPSSSSSKALKEVHKISNKSDKEDKTDKTSVVLSHTHAHHHTDSGAKEKVLCKDQCEDENGKDCVCTHRSVCVCACVWGVVGGFGEGGARGDLCVCIGVYARERAREGMRQRGRAGQGEKECVK